MARKSCHICFVEPKYEDDGPAEQSVLIEFLAKKFGLTIEHADPRELRAEGGEVFYGDTRIDIAYRDYETRDLIALEKEIGKPLDGMRTLLKQNSHDLLPDGGFRSQELLRDFDRSGPVGEVLLAR